MHAARTAAGSGGSMTSTITRTDQRRTFQPGQTTTTTKKPDGQTVPTTRRTTTGTTGDTGGNDSGGPASPVSLQTSLDSRQVRRADQTPAQLRTRVEGGFAAATADGDAPLGQRRVGPRARLEGPGTGTTTQPVSLRNPGDPTNPNGDPNNISARALKQLWPWGEKKEEG